MKHTTYSKFILILAVSLFGSRNGSTRPQSVFEIRSNSAPNQQSRSALSDRLTLPIDRFPSASLRVGEEYFIHNFVGADLTDSNLTGRYIVLADLRYARFSFSKLRNGGVTYSDLSFSQFNNSDLKGARLGYRMRFANFKDSNLNGARFEHFVSHGVGPFTVVTRLVDASGSNFENADLSNSNMESVFAPFANFSKANLSGTNASGMIVNYGVLTAANCTETIFGISNVKYFGQLANIRRQRALLNYINGDDANFFRANLKGAQLRGASLRRASFRLAILQGADLSGSDLAGADLRANLQGTRFRGASFNDQTLWPVGFDPIAHGALRKIQN